MAERKKIGELLKEAGLIDNFQLEAALSHQRSWGGKLGAVIVELRFAREEEIARVLAEKLRIPYIELSASEIPAEVADIIKPDIARKFSVMPVRKEGKSLVLAMADPLNIDVVDNIRFNTGMTIKPVLAMGSEIQDAIRKYYDKEPPVRETVPLVCETTVPSNASHTMDLARGIPDRTTPEYSRNPRQRENIKQLLQDVNSQKIELDALKSLLIDRGIIIQSELAKIIEQKKIGE